MAQQITINLLPIELKTNQKDIARKSLITKLSVLVLVLSIISAIAVLVAGFTFKVNVQNKNKQNEQLRNQIAGLGKEEGLVTTLKSRLDIINSISQKDSPQIQAFNLITILIPPGVDLDNFVVDKSGSIKISVKTDNVANLSTLFNNITNPKVHEGRIQSAKVSSLTLNSNQSITAEIELKLGAPQAADPAPVVKS